MGVNTKKSRARAANILLEILTTTFLFPQSETYI